MMHTFWHDLPQPFFILAPMEAVTDVVFRHVIKRAGAPDVFFSEFTNATGWVHAGERAIGGRLIHTEDESPIVAQIWGGEPGDMEQLARHCRELGYHGIDINMGCPAKSAIKSGGSALIRNPRLAAEAIAAAKTAGLPASVKTRLGYTRVDEWREWLTHLLRQDIVNLTIHLRTKREMSKVPAHHELISEIVKLRDEIAPQTLLTINGDIETRAHGLELIRQYPGVNGVMIGRGVFHDPFCFRVSSNSDATTVNTPARATRGGAAPTSTLGDDGADRVAAHVPRARNFTIENKFSSEGFLADSHRLSSPESSDLRANFNEIRDDGSGGDKQQALFDLLYYHLELFDQYQPQLHRPFETLKRFFKIYIRDFDGAADLRDKLMHTKSTDEVRAVLTQYKN